MQDSITSIDKQLEALIKENDEVNRVYKLATSVTGIGLQTAALMILHTNCFTRFDNWRQFACYAGTAPFDRTADAAQFGHEYPW